MSTMSDRKWCEALSSRWPGDARLPRSPSSTLWAGTPFDPRYLWPKSIKWMISEVNSNDFPRHFRWYPPQVCIFSGSVVRSTFLRGSVWPNHGCCALNGDRICFINILYIENHWKSMFFQHFVCCDSLKNLDGVLVFQHFAYRKPLKNQ